MPITVERSFALNVYEAIAALDNHQKNIAAAVLTGTHAGEMAVFSGQALFWPGTERDGSVSKAFLPAHTEEICNVRKSCILTIEGQSVYCEILGGVKKLVICGAGHVSIPIIQLGKMTDMHVTCIDDRPDFARQACEAGADTVLCSPFDEALRGISSDLDTYFVIVTRGHRFDKECLLEIFAKPYAYAGMMGSRSRVALLKESLLADGVPASQLDTLHAPIGLSIGAETPAEIAISIFAQIVSVEKKLGSSLSFQQKLLASLREREEQKRVLATIISKRGSAPRNIGTKMLVRQDGSITGTIGGGCTEMYVIQQALYMMEKTTRTLHILEVNITPETASEEGMVCGGRIQVLLQLA